MSKLTAARSMVLPGVKPEIVLVGMPPLVAIDRQRAVRPGEGDDTTRNRARFQLLGAAADDCAAHGAARKDQLKSVLGDDGADRGTAEPDVLLGAAVDYS